MSAARELVRRLAVVIIGIVAAAVIVRPAVSSALVTRGDELAFRGDVERAREMYRRALLADANNVVAADRYVFSAMMSHRVPLLEAGIAVASASLTRSPRDIAMHMDRALCEQALHRLSSAAVDFEFAGTHARDPRAMTFAALDVANEHKARALQLLRIALGFDPKFLPARRDLNVLSREKP